LIRAERERRGVGLREFAAKVGKSPAFMVRLETDDVVPSVAEETLGVVADALGLERDMVMALAKKMPKDLAPEDELDLAVYRRVKSMTQHEKRRLLDNKGEDKPRRG
jgi:transcriptional regulator with XRE-family HTH domain